MITKSKRILSSVLAMILLITGLLPMSVSAADVTMDLSKAEVSWDYTLTDEEGNAFAAAYGLKAEVIIQLVETESCCLIRKNWRKFNGE